MKIQQHTSNSKKINTHVIITNEPDSNTLGKQGLSKEKGSYIHSKIKDSKKTIDAYYINQYKKQIWIVHAINEPNYVQKEKLRITGANIAAKLKIQKQTLVVVENLLPLTSFLLYVIEGLELALYDFNQYFSNKKKKVIFQEIIKAGVAGKQELVHLNHLYLGIFISNKLINDQVQYLKATQLSKDIKKLAKEAGFSFEYFGKKKIESQKMTCLLTVNQGSIEQPTFNILEWKPVRAKNNKPLVFVGKGVMYDTGGSSTKISAGMEQMKGDMAGSAAVIGAIHAIAKSKLPYHVVGLIPATDNRIDNTSIVPGDIITTYSEKTVEVINTDAEGRLILADALHYAFIYKPELVIDLTTLTRAAHTAEGDLGIVAMEKNAKNFFKELKNTVWNVNERLVKLPLRDENDELIQSNIANLKNIGGVFAGAITVGNFLEHFTYSPWIHHYLSNALLSNMEHYQTSLSTGACKQLLVEFVSNRVKKSNYSTIELKKN